MDLIGLFYFGTCPGIPEVRNATRKPYYDGDLSILKYLPQGRTYIQVLFNHNYDVSV